MLARIHTQAFFLALLLLGVPALGQGQEVLQGQAGLYPLRAYFKEPAAVGPARLVVELGKPKSLFKLPEGRHTPDPSETTATPQPRELAVSVVMEMPDMVSVKPTSVKLKPSGSSRFEGDVLITMKGDWRVQFVVQTPEGEFRPLARFKVGPGTASRTGAGDGGLELCDPDASEPIPLKIQSFPDPARVGANRIRVELPDAVNVPVMIGVSQPGLALGIPPTEAVRQEDGGYEAIVNLPMAGYWQVRVDLNGRALPPFALTVEEQRAHGPSRTLLPLAAAAILPLLVFVAWRRRPMLGVVALGAGLLLATLGLGTLVEGAWPARHSSAMEMDMLRYDMGMGHLSAPLPVLEAKLEKTRFVTTRDLSATVTAGKQKMILAPTGGVVSNLPPVGSAVEAGDKVAQVGANTVLAPSPGVVVKTLLEEGATVESGAALLALGDPRTIAVRALAPLREHGTLTPGLPVDVVGDDGRRARGKLTFVSAVNREQGIEVEATVDNTRPKGAPVHRTGASTPTVDLGLFTLGEAVTLRIELDRPRWAISVPREAIRETPDGSARVFLISEVAGQRVAREQKVTLGASNETHAEILTGLSAGQTIVAGLETSLRDGDVVVRATLGEGVFRSLAVPGEGSH